MGIKMINPQAKVILASFLYFSVVLEKNNMLDKIPNDLKKLFRKLGFISQKYQQHIASVTDEIDIITKDCKYDVDFLLLSVSMLIDYYDQVSGKPRYFTPMSCKEIVTLQDEILDTAPSDLVDNTFDFSELLVKGLLNGN